MMHVRVCKYVPCVCFFILRNGFKDDNTAQVG